MFNFSACSLVDANLFSCEVKFAGSAIYFHQNYDIKKNCRKIFCSVLPYFMLHMGWTCNREIYACTSLHRTTICIQKIEYQCIREAELSSYLAPYLHFKDSSKNIGLLTQWKLDTNFQDFTNFLSLIYIQYVLHIITITYVENTSLKWNPDGHGANEFLQSNSLAPYQKHLFINWGIIIK